MKTKHPGLARLFGLGSLLLLCVLLTAGVGGAQEGGTYTKPVSKTFADTFADPSLIKAKDGYWYAYGTSDPLREGEGTAHTIPMTRSKDLVHWDYVGDAFDSPSEVSWAAPNAGIWAPDIRYIDGKYYMYYVVTETTVTPEPNDNAVGVATAPTPTGPWKDSGAPVVGPRRGDSGDPGDFKWTFDPNEFTAPNGTHYLYYGSYYGGIWVRKLSDDATRKAGKPTMVAIDNRYEGAYVVRHGGFYYLFGSSANCCAGPTTGYSVYVGRSRSPMGPFRDRQGQTMTQSRVGGSIVVTPNGNKWVGTGHNAVVTDLSGQDWLVYHAIDRRDPYLDEPFGINQRPMLLDRLDWIGGWPTVRAGRWASEGPERAPVTDWAAGGDVDLSGAAASCQPLVDVTAGRSPADYRAEADLRLSGAAEAAGLVTSWRSRSNYLVSWLDREAGALVVEVVHGGKAVVRETSPLPAGFRYDTWHNVAAELRGRELT